MEKVKVKVKNIKTGVIKEVSKSLAGDYVGTGEFELYQEKKVEETKPKSFVNESKKNV